MNCDYRDHAYMLVQQTTVNTYNKQWQLLGSEFWY